MPHIPYLPQGLPDVNELEKLANAYFSASLPGDASQFKDASPTSQADTPSRSALATPPAQQEFGAGAGVNDPSPFKSAPHLPASVTGSGISPTAIHQGNAVDIADPQTSLPDPHPHGYGYGHFPASTAGSGGASHHIADLDNQHSKASYQGLPYEHEHSFEREFRSALSRVSTYTPSSQFAFTPQRTLDEKAYYFTNDAQLHPGVESRLTTRHQGHDGQPLPAFNVNWIRNDFPILAEQVNGKPLIWLDNAATTHKPNHVINRLVQFYRHENSNIHRAAHELAARATDAYEEARQTVQHFINAASSEEIIFVRGTTEGINLVAYSWGEQYLQEGDEIIISHLEHHANIVPWQILSNKKKLKLRVIPVDDDGQIILDEYSKLLNPKTKLVSITVVSNALGTITPIKQIVDLAHQAGAKVLVDGAQSVSHIRTDVQSLDADWFVFSGHKIFGPTGIGVLYGKQAILNETQPWQGGGNMIEDVTFGHTRYHRAPARFEAGTGNIADAVGLGAALEYINRIGIDHIYQYEHYLLHYATHALGAVPGLRFIGTAANKTSVLSFVLDGYTTAEVGQTLSEQGIAVRAGHHCAQPILRRFGLESTVRPSLAFYNTCAEIDMLVETVWKLATSKRFKS